MKKTVISRIFYALLTAVMTTMIAISMSITVSAAEIETAPMNDVSTAEKIDTDNSDENDSIQSSVQLSSADDNGGIVLLGGAGAGGAVAGAGGAAGNSGSAGADNSYQNVVTFFVTWIRRIGALVALVGAVMFGLAIKNNDAEQKQSGLLTMVAGFVVVAITAAVDMFDLFA